MLNNDKRFQNACPGMHTILWCSRSRSITCTCTCLDHANSPLAAAVLLLELLRLILPLLPRNLNHRQKLNLVAKDGSSSMTKLRNPVHHVPQLRKPRPRLPAGRPAASPPPPVLATSAASSLQFAGYPLHCLFGRPIGVDGGAERQYRPRRPTEHSRWLSSSRFTTVVSSSAILLFSARSCRSSASLSPLACKSTPKAVRS